MVTKQSSGLRSMLASNQKLSDTLASAARNSGELWDGGSHVKHVSCSLAPVSAFESILNPNKSPTTASKSSKQKLSNATVSKTARIITPSKFENSGALVPAKSTINYVKLTHSANAPLQPNSCVNLRSGKQCRINKKSKEKKAQLAVSPIKAEETSALPGPSTTKKTRYLDTIESVEGVNQRAINLQLSLTSAYQNNARGDLSTCVSNGRPI